MGSLFVDVLCILIHPNSGNALVVPASNRERFKKLFVKTVVQNRSVFCGQINQSAAKLSQTSTQTQEYIKPDIVTMQ